MTIKNIWSLNVDEAIVAEKIKKELGKDYEVFFPINSQLKDIDLLIQNPKTGKSISVREKLHPYFRASKGLKEVINN